MSDKERQRLMKNARARYKNALETQLKVRRSRKLSKESRQQLNTEIKGLRQAIEYTKESVIKNITSEEEKTARYKALLNAERYTESAKATTVHKLNIQNYSGLLEIARASRSDAEAFVSEDSIFTKAGVQAFFRFMQPTWQGEEYRAGRIRAINKALGTNDITEAYKLVTNMPEVRNQIEIANMIDKNLDVSSLSPEARAYYEANGIKEGTKQKGSPTWVMELPQFKQADWASYLASMEQAEKEGVLN